MELQRLQGKLKDALDLPQPNKMVSSIAATHMAASPSFDSFYRNKIERKDAELETEFGKLMDEEIPIRRTGGRRSKMGSDRLASKSGRKSNPLRDIYATWKHELGTEELSAPTSVPTQLQLSHVYSLQYKNTLYDKALRSVWQLCPPALTRTLSLLRGLLDGFSHDTTVLDHIFAEQKQLLRSPAALLAIGEVPMLNFDLDAITGAIPSPASQRWLAQSKLPPSVSLSGVELGGLDPMSVPGRTAGRKVSSSRVSFSSLPPYLADPYSPQLSHALSDTTSPRDQELGDARRHLSFESSSSGVLPHPAPADIANYSLGILANSVTNAVVGQESSHSVLPEAPNTVSGCSYIAPGSPLISELAICMSNPHITHRLDYLAADLTSISSLLWPSSACPSAYFPPAAGASRSKSNTIDPNHPLPKDIDPAQANVDFGSFLGLGSAASYAALSSGALSLSLASAPTPTASNTTSSAGLPRAESVPSHLRSTASSFTSNTFTSCIACKHASVDTLLVQLQHDAICVKSGEDEASYLWRQKWQELHNPRSEQAVSSSQTPISYDQVVQTTNQDEAEKSSTLDVPQSETLRSPSPTTTSSDTVPPISAHDVPVMDPANRGFSAATTSQANTNVAGLSPSPSPPPSSNPSSVSSTSTSGTLKRTSSSGVAGAPTSTRPKSSTFTSFMPGSSGSTQNAANPTPIPHYIPVSDMNLLHLRHRFSFLRHVIFSLLKGRPVVIHAEARNRPWVEQVVASLTCFVPGHHLSKDSAAQCLHQIETNGSTDTSSQYLPRPPFLTKVVPWRDARDVIFEAIHNQGITSASTKARLKHTKLVISRFLELHIQKMKSYSTVAKQSTDTSTTSASKPDTAASPAAPDSAINTSGNASPHGSSSSTPVINIPTLSVASRQAIKLSHLSHIKLIGLDKSCPVPKSVERYITYWDWEAEELTCVPYEKGKLLDAMINPKKQWPDEASYRSHIHFHLSDLATRAWMYYHMCCIGLVVGGLSPLSTFPGPMNLPPTNSSSPSPASAVFSIPSPYGSVNSGTSGYSPPVDSSRNPLSVSGSPANDWTSGQTPTEPSHIGGAHMIAPKVTTRSLTAAPLLTSPRSNTPSSPPHHAGQGGASKTSPIPALGADDLGFEPSSGMMTKPPIHTSSNGLGASQQSLSSSTHATPSKLRDSVSLALGPSLSNFAESGGSSLTSPPSTLSSPRSHHQSNSLWLSGGISAVGPSTATMTSSQVPSTPSSKGPTGSTKPTPSRLSKTFSSGAIDSRAPAAASTSTSSTQNSAPTPADYAFQAHTIQQRTKAAYFASLKLLENDAEIIEYLAELIKSQQSQDVRGTGSAFQSFSSLQLNDLVSIALAHDPEMAPPPQPSPVVPGSFGTSAPIKLDFTATKTFKNVLLN